MLLIRFSHKFGRGLLSSPDFYCTTGISVLQGDSQIGFQSEEANGSCPECGKIVTDCNCIPFTFRLMCSTAIIQSILWYCVPRVMSKRIVSDKTWENHCKVSIRYDIIVPCKSGQKSIKDMISKII